MTHSPARPTQRQPWIAKATILHLEAALEVQGNSLAQAAEEGRTRVELSGHRFCAKDKEELVVPWSSSKYSHSHVEDHEKEGQHACEVNHCTLT